MTHTADPTVTRLLCDALAILYHQRLAAYRAREEAALADCPAYADAQEQQRAAWMDALDRAAEAGL